MRWILIFISIFLFGTENNLTKEINLSIKNIKNELNKNEFYINYQNYLKYKSLEDMLQKYQRHPQKNKDKILSIQTELDLLKNNKNIFESLIKIKPLPAPPTINNPFAIFGALSYEKEIKSILNQNIQNYQKFYSTYQKLIELNNLYKKAGIKDKHLKKLLLDFETINNVYKTKIQNQKSKAQIYISQVNQEIQREINKLIYLAISIFISILIFYFIKLGVRKYVKGESIYLINKILNFINITIIILIILFFYINNATYLITILGFASAGIAIAMKDWFMNIFGWFVIMTSGNFKVGDRIKITLQNGNVQIVGDVIDITLTKIVMYEDVTLTTLTLNRRAGRIVFIPNNVVFNNPIFNYTHHGLSTVWDGIDITITFDSNYKKAKHIINGIVQNLSKGYTDITKRRLHKLKAIYHIKNANVEPKIFTFINENGIVISCWYLNNYMTLSLRSKIYSEILEAFSKEDDIKLAHTTYTIIKKEENESAPTKTPL
ncbi:MAG: mechanosensitive ion channel domain-containing protein [Nautiliaceae bacterium]